MKTLPSLVVIVATLVATTACRREPGTSKKPLASGSSPRPAANESVLLAIRRAEYSRNAGALPATALTDHDSIVRRAAARALSRIADAESRVRLEQSLEDEDAEVVAWSAYGLGETCTNREPETVRRLVTRAASLATDPGDSVPSPWSAIADALARCGTPLGERTLSAWLDGLPLRANQAALALSRLATRRHNLDDRTIVALLDAASSPTPLPAALAAFSQIEALSGAAQKRLVDVAEQAVRGGGAARQFAIRALASAGTLGFDALASWVGDEGLSATDRAAAATTLGRFGSDAQDVLASVLVKLLPPDSIDERWVDAHFAPVAATLEALVAASKTDRDALARLADLAIPADATPGFRRRFVAIRCDAAVALAGAASHSKRLLACDPEEHGRAGGLAMVRVLDRGALSGARLEEWKRLASTGDPAVRRAALSLLPRHIEAPKVTDTLVNALGASAPGLVAEAAHVIANAPRFGREGPGSNSGDVAEDKVDATPIPEIVDALAHALDAVRPPDQIESRVALSEAAAALDVLSLKPRVERYCTSENITLRRAAGSSLRALGTPNASCPAPGNIASPKIVPAERKPVTLTFVTDAGRFGVTLERTLAPLAVDRIVDLARAGFYDGVTIHRGSPGFVVQLGDRVGDGSGGAGRPPLPSETSPVEFGAFAVGLALAGRDTGSSQIFITMAEEPALYGDFPLIGRAGPESANVVPGDVIRSVDVRE